MKYREEWKDQIDEVDQSTGLAPIHHIAIHVGTYTNLLLLNFLTYGNADVDAKAMDGKTALMLAVEVCSYSGVLIYPFHLQLHVHVHSYVTANRYVAGIKRKTRGHTAPKGRELYSEKIP